MALTRILTVTPQMICFFILKGCLVSSFLLFCLSTLRCCLAYHYHYFAFFSSCCSWPFLQVRSMRARTRTAAVMTSARRRDTGGIGSMIKRATAMSKVILATYSKGTYENKAKMDASTRLLPKRWVAVMVSTSHSEQGEVRGLKMTRFFCDGAYLCIYKNGYKCIYDASL